MRISGTWPQQPYHTHTHIDRYMTYLGPRCCNVISYPSVTFQQQQQVKRKACIQIELYHQLDATPSSVIHGSESKALSSNKKQQKNAMSDLEKVIMVCWSVMCAPRVFFFAVFVFLSQLVCVWVFFCMDFQGTTIAA